MIFVRTWYFSGCLCLSVCCLSVCCLSACGGGGETATDTTSNTPVTLSYPDGRVMAIGQFTNGTTTRVGTWQEYFDAPASPQQWRRTYIAGTWDQAQDWREWNADGSIRNDVGDR